MKLVGVAAISNICPGGPASPAFWWSEIQEQLERGPWFEWLRGGSLGAGVMGRAKCRGLKVIV